MVLFNKNSVLLHEFATQISPYLIDTCESVYFLFGEKCDTEWMDGWMGGWNGQMDGRMPDGWMDGWMDNGFKDCLQP